MIGIGVYSLKYLFPPKKVSIVAVFSDTVKERREDVVT
jgi:hypothetical protein